MNLPNLQVYAGSRFQGAGLSMFDAHPLEVGGSIRAFTLNLHVLIIFWGFPLCDLVFSPIQRQKMCFKL